MANIQKTTQIFVQVEYDIAPIQKTTQVFVQTETDIAPIQKTTQIFVQVETDITPREMVSSLCGEVEYQQPSKIQISQFIAEVEYTQLNEIKVSQIIAEVEYIPSTVITDGISSDGIVFGGDPSGEIGIQTAHDPTSSGGIVFNGDSGQEIFPNFYQDINIIGGIVFGSIGTEVFPVYSIDAISSGGIVFGGTIWERSNNVTNFDVAVKGGIYRIDGVLYPLVNDMTVTGLGLVAEVVFCGSSPATAGYWRYDLLSIGASQIITVTHGASALTPLMPALPTDHIKLDHVLRYSGQMKIVQSDIGRNYIAPIIVKLGIVLSDADLAWGEMTSTITITCYDQYNQVYRNGVVINASFMSGNGEISPESRTVGASGVVTFLYTRDGHDPGDIGPVLQFSAEARVYGFISINLRDSAGDLMFTGE